MSRRKHWPSRPHWERIAARRSNNVNEVVTVASEYMGWYGRMKTLRRENRPAAAKPGK